MKVYFEEISVKATRYWTDENGKKRQETKKFFQTVNPFNVDSNGVPKTPYQIREEVYAARDKWLEEHRR